MKGLQGFKLKNIIIYLIIIVGILEADSIEEAKKMFDEEKKFEKALEIFNTKPENMDSNYYISKAYFYGLGVVQDYQKGCEYAKKAADRNHPTALNNFAVCHKLGLGKYEKNLLEALIYFKMASNFDSVDALRNLGEIYTQGSREVKKDFSKAIMYYEKAIDLDDYSSIAKLADLYFYNLKDNAKALEYYNLAEKYDVLDGIGFQNVSSLYKINSQNEKSLEYKRKAYDSFKEIAASDKNDPSNIFYIIRLLEEYPEFSTRTNEIEYWYKKIVYSNNNEFQSVDFKYRNIATTFLYSYYIANNQKDKAIHLAKDTYKLFNNIEMGCNYSSFLQYNEPKKAYELVNEIIKSNPRGKSSDCSIVMSNLYINGNYVAQDYYKALKVLKKSLNTVHEKKKGIIFEKIAEIYQENIKNSKESVLWYEKAYKATDSKEYLSKIYKIKSLETKEIGTSKLEQKIYPLVNNFTNKKQIITYLESAKYLFVSTDDKSIKMYDKSSLELLKEFRSWIGNSFNGIFSTLAYDERKELLYTSTLNSGKDFSNNNTIKVFDTNSGKVIKTIKNIKALRNTYLSLSEDGKYLVALNNEAYINIINEEDGKNLHFDFSSLKEKIIKVKIEKKNDDYLVYLISEKNTFYTISINKKRVLKKETFKGQVSFDKKYNKIENYSENELKRIFSSRPLDIKNTKIKSNNIFIESDKNSFKFNFKNLTLKNIQKKITKPKESISTIKVVPKEKNRILEVYDENNNLLTEIGLLHVEALKYKVLENKYILVVTSDITYMPIYNLDGQPIANLAGFNTIQTNLSYQNELLITFGKDNIINVFDLKNLDSYSFVRTNYDYDSLNSLKQITGNNSITEFFDNDAEIIELLEYNKYKYGFKPTVQQYKSYVDLILIKKENINPFVSLYIKNESDWIMYTRKGLFTYGGNGYKLLKYHKNQGLNKEAKIIENDKLFDKFYRPDLIKKILNREKVNIPIDIQSVIINIMPPELNILSSNMLSNKDIDLTYRVCDNGSGIADMRLLINGHMINPPTSRGFKVKSTKNKDEKCKVYQSVHTLLPGKNTISLKAYDRDNNIANQSEEIEMVANYKIEEKPNLYFLSIAVSDYEDDMLDLNYPVKDVLSVKEKFLNNSTQVYENTHIYELHDNKVSLLSVEKTFNEIGKRIKINDVFILYIAGHGIIENGLYQFLPYRKSKKISIGNLKNNLSKISTNKSLVMLDTCQSGAVLESIDDSAVKNRLSYDSSISYIVASSKEQVALEGYKNHGVFTYSVLDAFKNYSKLRVWGLADHIYETVPKITQEKFYFKQTPQAKLNLNFILSDGEK